MTPRQYPDGSARTAWIQLRQVLIPRVLVITTVTIFTPGVAAASLLGDSIIADATWINCPSEPLVLLRGATATVNDGAEFSTLVGSMEESEFRIDFRSDNTFKILFRLPNEATWPTELAIAITDLDFSDGALLQSVRRIGTDPFAPGFLNFISFSPNVGGNTIRIASSSDEFETGRLFSAEFAYTTSRAESTDQTVPTPEPGTFVLLVTGGLIWARQRRCSSQHQNKESVLSPLVPFCLGSVRHTLTSTLQRER